MHQPSRASNEGAPAGMRRAAVKAKFFERTSKPNNHAQWLQSATALRSDDIVAVGRSLAKDSKALARSGCIGISRPLPFLAALSRSSITVPSCPCGFRSMSHDSADISQARRPAFADSSTIARFLTGWRVRRTKRRSTSRSVLDSIFACRPAIALSQIDMLKYRT